VAAKRKNFSAVFARPVLTLFFLSALMASGYSPLAHADGLLNINYIDPNNLGGIVPQNIANEAIKMFGIYTVHRPYSGATSILESNTLDVDVEATMVKIGDGLVNALKADGLASANTTGVPTAVPMAKLNIRKGFSDWFDIGLSGLTYGGQKIFGGDLKFVFSNPEEGLSWALRLGYTYASVPYAYVTTCSTFSPELVASRRLDFAEPYFGIGGRYISGTLSVPFHPPVGNDFTVTKSGSGETGYAFTGVYFRILGPQGLRLGIEGSFDISGYHTVGGIFGLGF
jgi:hypothetical protein